MKTIKKIIAVATFVGMIATSSRSLMAQDIAEVCETAGGCGYEQCRRVPSLAPAIALGTIAVVAIVAVAVQNSNHHSSHSHSSCSSSSS